MRTHRDQGAPDGRHDGCGRGAATEAWDAANARRLAYDDRVRAVITWIDASREDAEAADSRAAKGRSLGALDGMLLGLKDNIDTAGTRTTSGARFLSGNVPERDATAVTRLREQGIVVNAKLNMAELAWGATTQNATYGACRNPWDLDRIPGGSSGGSGAAIAAGYCDAALGTDTGASVRIPSSLNGVVGLRPSVGTISNHGVFPPRTRRTSSARWRAARSTSPGSPRRSSGPTPRTRTPSRATGRPRRRRSASRSAA